MSPERTVAFLGAGGTMGLGMAANIADAGFHVRVWNRSREKAEPLAERGAEICETPAQAAEGAQIVVTMLSDVDAVVEAVDGEQGALRAAEGTPVWVQMSTIGVSGTERCAEIADRRGASFVDAPVLGTKQPAEKGELVILASGPEELRARLEPIFDAVGRKTMWLGPAGGGSRLKLVTNGWLVAVVEGVAETIALAEGADVDPRDFLEAIAGGPLDLPYMQMKAKAMIERDFTPSFRLALAAKDAGLVAELADRHDLDLPLIATVSERLAQAVREHGEEDLAATYLTSAPERPGRG